MNISIDSPIFLFCLLATGMVLAVQYPYRAFLLATFILVAFPLDELAQSRTILGSYFNAIDACLLISLAAMVSNSVQHRRIEIPKLFLIIIVTLSIATILTIFQLGITYETIRAFRWALSFPLAYLTAANMITSEQRVRELMQCIWSATIVASVQGLLFSVDRIEVFNIIGNYSNIRSPKYLSASMIILPVLIICPWPKKMSHKLILLASGIIFLTNIILSQNRSTWIADIVATLACWIVFRSKERLQGNIQRIAIISLFLLVSSLMWQLFFSNIKLYDLIFYRVFELSDPQGTSLSRRLALAYEWNAWLNSNMIFGRGLSYFQSDYGNGIALNHLGYLTYLSQLGVVGLFVYGFIIPLQMLKNSVKLYHNCSLKTIQMFAIFVGSTVSYYVVVFTMSGSFLSHSIIPGILAGGVWALVIRSESEIRMPLYFRKPILAKKRWIYRMENRNPQCK